MEQKTAIAPERTGESIGPGDQIPPAPSGGTGPERLDQQRTGQTQTGQTQTATLAREHAPPLTGKGDAGGDGGTASEGQR